MALLMLAMAASWPARADWPTKLTFGNGNELGVKGAFEYDGVAFTDDRLQFSSFLP